MTTWDKEEVYDDEISPLILEVIALCKEHRIPAAMMFQLNDDDDEHGPLYCSTCIPCRELDVSDKMSRVIDLVQPDRGGVIAETVETDAAGATRITVRQVR